MNAYFDKEMRVAYCSEASVVLCTAMYVVVEDFTWYIAANKHVTIPRGFMTDGASVPSAFKGVLPPFAQYGQAAVLHDYLCEYLSVTLNGAPFKITRFEADTMFCEAMGYLHVNDIVKEAMHTAVVLYTNWKDNAHTPSTSVIKRNLEARWVNKYNRSI